MPTPPIVSAPSHRLPAAVLRTALPLAATLAATLAAPAAETRLQGHTFIHPEGFTIEVAATSDLIPRPIAGSFDPQGNLYVTDSSGLNLPPSEQLKDPRSRVLRLVDKDGDGHFDQAGVYADRVMFPQGCLWHAGSLYVAGPPSIWKFTDTDGDGVADKREEWYRGGVLTGCANDVHGPYLGPEGMLYWTKGAFSRLDLKDGRGRPIQDRCAHVFRAWPDGSGLESILSGGMDNPVEVAFTPDGEPIVISTFLDLSQPGRRDGLAHAVYGGVHGKINDVVDEPGVRRTGDLMPVLTQFGPAAACALTQYGGDTLGPGFQGNLFGTLFNLRKVTRHVLRRAGSSYASEDSDFLVSDQIDFRPTDVFEDADGSLLVVDTGGWYKLCCPSSQLAKADVLGSIYRIRKTGTKPLPLAARGEGYARLVRPPALPRNAVTELKGLATVASPESAPRLRETLRTHLGRVQADAESATLARLAAEGLGRMRDLPAVPDLFQAIAQVDPADRFLEHALLHALIEIGDIATGRHHLGAAATPAPVRRAALLVLEQAGGSSSLQPADIAPWLNAEDPRLRETAGWVARRHPEWSAALAGHFRSRLTDPTARSEELAGWEALLGIFTGAEQGQPFLAEIARGGSFRVESRQAALQAMTSARPKTWPEGWREAVLATLAQPAPPHVLILVAIQASKALPFPKEGDAELTRSLRKLTANAALPAPVRIDALGTLPAGSPAEGGDLELVSRSLQPGQPPTERLAAATAAGRLRFHPDQLQRLVPALGHAGPLELPRLLTAFQSGGDETLGRRVLAQLTASPGLRALRPEDAASAMARFPAPIRDGLQALLLAQRSDATQDLARLDTLLADLNKLQGQVRAGQAVFNSTKAACSSCHRLGYLGGNLGPDLTSIGQARTERDLLEAVVFPSASFVRSYEPWIASTKDGEEYAGVLRRDTPEEITLATGPGAETRIRRSDLTELRMGSLSTMPAGLDQVLTPQELADLIAFLKNTKWGAN